MKPILFLLLTVFLWLVKGLSYFPNLTPFLPYYAILDQNVLTTSSPVMMNQVVYSIPNRPLVTMPSSSQQAPSTSSTVRYYGGGGGGGSHSQTSHPPPQAKIVPYLANPRPQDGAMSTDRCGNVIPYSKPAKPLLVQQQQQQQQQQQAVATVSPLPLGMPAPGQYAHFSFDDSTKYQAMTNSQLAAELAFLGGAATQQQQQQHSGVEVHPPPYCQQNTTC